MTDLIILVALDSVALFTGQSILPQIDETNIPNIHVSSNQLVKRTFS